VRVRKIGSEGPFWRDVRGDGEGRRRRELWWITRSVGRRFRKGRRVVMCCGKVERGVFCGRMRFVEVFNGAMGEMMIFTWLSMFECVFSMIEDGVAYSMSSRFAAPVEIKIPHS